MNRMFAAGLLVSVSGAAAETPAEIARALEAGHPAVARILDSHPEIMDAWKEDFWADALLRSPLLPGGRWRSHDLRRPQPPTVHPRFEECPGTSRPLDAVVVLAPEVEDGLIGDDLASWTRKGGVLTASGRHGNRIASRQAFGAIQLHLEYRTPDSWPLGAWQYRGNSGVFLMGLYEVQILDSWDNPTYPDGAMGALYGQRPPRVIASLPPGRWQCLDIRFVPPVFAGGRLRSPARATVSVNDVVVQRNAAFFGQTAFGGVKPYRPHAARLPFTLQDHGDPTSRVSFRNIWVRPIDSSQR